MFFNCVDELDKKASFEIISKDDKNTIISKLKIEESIKRKLNIRSATPDEMPNLIAQHSASAMFFKPDISKLGSSPTRLGEILAIGRPIICNSGVGDLNKFVSQNNIGIMVEKASYDSMFSAVKKLYEMINDPYTPRKCRNFAEKYYSLNSGSKKYEKIYKNLL